LSYKLEEIKELAEEISKIEGVQAVVLYGSYARGDFTEGSDVDFLVVFQDKSSLKKGWRTVTEITAKREIFVQAVTMTMDELMTSSLLSSILREGKMLYSTKPLDLRERGRLKPYALITYDLSGMPPNRKVKCLQSLHGRRSGKYTYEGRLTKLKGFSVGRNCLMIPLENMTELINFLEKEGAHYVIRYVWCD